MSRRLLGAVVIALAVVGALATTSASAQQVADSGGLQLLDRSILSDDEFLLRVRLPGVIDETDVVSIAVHARLDDRSAFLAATDRDTAGPILVRTDDEVGELDIPFSGELTARLPIGPEALSLDDAGVYPVSVAVTSEGGTRLADLVTHLVIAPATTTTSTVAVGLTMDVRPAEGPAGDIDDDDATARWIDALIAHDTVPITVQVNGRLLDDSANDPRIRRLRSRLRAGNSELVATPYVPIDEAALTIDGLAEATEALLATGVATLEAFANSAPDQTMHFTPEPADQTSASVWRDRGVRHLVMADDASAQIDGRVEANTETGPIDVIVVPERFANATPGDPLLAAHHLLAELAVIAITADHPTSSMFSYRTGAGADPVFLSTLLDGLALSAPLIDVTTASQAFATPPLVTDAGQPLDIAFDDSGETSRLDGDIANYREAERVLAAYRSMIRAEDAPLLHDQLAETLLFSLGLGVSGNDREAVADRVVDRVNIELQAIEPPPLGSVNLTSRSATVPFAFQNNADYPMRIEARFIAEKAKFSDFDDGESLTLVLEPQAVTSREVQVEALSSGSFPLRIELLSPDGGVSLGTVDLTMRSTAPSGIGIIISVGAAAVLVLWWGRELLRSSRRRRDAAERPTAA